MKRFLLWCCSLFSALSLTAGSEQAYLFDIDGVLVNPHTKSVEQPELFDQIVNRLERGDWLGLNTGRQSEFMIEHILEPLEQRLSDKGLLQRIFACGEKGGVWIVYDAQSQRTTHVHPLLQMPHKLREEIQEVVSQTPFDDVVFYDGNKKTMISVELKRGKPIAAFDGIKHALHDRLKTVLLNYPHLVLDSTLISFDIQPAEAGKDLGARKFVEWVESKGQSPHCYFTFGDSRSDYAMHEELQRLGKSSTFVFVGGQQLLKGKNWDNVIFPNEFTITAPFLF